MVSAISRLKNCHMKRCLEFENNTAGHDFCRVANMLARTTVYVSYPHIGVIHTFPVLDLLNKLIFMFNVVIIG